jgi:hypothetical protein
MTVRDPLVQVFLLAIILIILIFGSFQGFPLFD